MVFLDFSHDSVQLAGIALVFLCLLIYYWATYTHWSRRNVKGPRPLPIVGNLLSFIKHSRQTLETEWVKEYGKIYGYYMASKPYLTCADAEVLRRISVKDFDKFPNHLLIGVRNKYQDKMLIHMNDDKWRSTRAIMTPTFSSGKMRIMFKKMSECSNLFVEEVESYVDHESGKGVIDLRKVVGGHIMSCSMSSFYGIEPKRNNFNMLMEWSEKARTTFEQTYFRFIMYNLFPWKFLKLINLPLMPESQLEFFIKAADKIIETRKGSSGQYKDFLQLLLDAKIDDPNNDDLQNKDKNQQIESHHVADIYSSTNANDEKDKSRSSKCLTDEEVSVQAMLFIMVSVETTLSLVCHTIYLLAHHQDIQDRLYKELNQFKDKPLQYEQLSSLQYLDCVISESLRLMSPAISLDRLAKEDYYIEDYNIMIPKGTIVNLAFYAILRDPDYWPEPEKFDPERFMPENKHKIVPGSYCPFGIGPRACIGYRFALLEAKTSLVELMNRFHFHKAPGTKYPPEQEKASYVLNVNKNMLVTVERRN